MKPPSLELKTPDRYLLSDDDPVVPVVPAPILDEVEDVDVLVPDVPELELVVLEDLVVLEELVVLPELDELPGGGVLPFAI